MRKQLPLPAGTVLQARYEITELLGAGGMGAVYEAYDKRTSAYIALKETFADDDYEVSAFEREAKLLANLDHEALPRVMDYFAENDGYFLVMELIRGEDLEKSLIKNGKPFEVATVLGWADQILDALEDLHSRGIIHRDIKPANIKVTPRGKIKLIDFGIAKGTAGDLTKIQTINAASGSYSPLEQILRVSEDAFEMLRIGFFDKTYEIAQQSTDARADIYALGATLYQLLTNRMPVNAPTRALAAWSGQADKLIPAHQINPQIPNAVSRVLWEAMEIDRAKRPASAIAMRQGLKEAIKPVPQPTPNPQPSPKPEPPRPAPVKMSFLKRRKFLVGGVVIAAIILPLLLIVSLAFYLQPPPDQSLITLNEHKGQVTSVAFSPDGKMIVSGDLIDKTIKLWDVAGGNAKYTLYNDKDAPLSLMFSRDGKEILSRGYGDKIKSWEIMSRNLKQNLTVETFDSSKGKVIPDGRVSSPDGNTIVSENDDGRVKFWAIDERGIMQIFTESADFFEKICFSPDVKTIAITSGKRTKIKIYDIANGNLKQIIELQRGFVNSIAFSPDSKKIVIGNGTQSIVAELWKGTPIDIFDVESGNLKQTFIQWSRVDSVAFSPDGKILASGGADGLVKLWRVE